MRSQCSAGNYKTSTLHLDLQAIAGYGYFASYVIKKIKMPVQIVATSGIRLLADRWFILRRCRSCTPSNAAETRAGSAFQSRKGHPHR
ncbi:MAG: hypothetical protein ABR555_06560 [Pyrinomonadaceae bacterium]